ncbi:MAG: hypothetical protein AAGF07_04570 [Patescibacteria group bacterium]
MFLPSLLEYSTQDLQHKITLLKNNTPKYYQLSKNPDKHTLHLHLDFVLPGFAKDRRIMTSLSPVQVIEILELSYSKDMLNLTIHLMGDVEDLLEAFKFFSQYKLNPLWEYTIFVPERYLDSWAASDRSNHNTNFNTGIWYDYGEWDTKTFEQSRHFLLMSVVAGKSGQKLADEVANKAKAVTSEHPDKQFIFDGGWSIEKDNNLSNVQIVSYSSFWNKFLEK